MNRKTHTFQFKAALIAEGARQEAEYHEKRRAWWSAEYERAVGEAKDATVEVREYEVTGGKRASVEVSSKAAARINEACTKREEHRLAADAFRIEAATYGSQDRVYELDADDVMHFRLAGGPRSD